VIHFQFRYQWHDDVGTMWVYGDDEQQAAATLLRKLRQRYQHREEAHTPTVQIKFSLLTIRIVRSF